VMRDVGARDPAALLQFVVPTGNFGDILAGWYAKKMGLPMDRLVVATNANDILARFWATGRYEKSVSVDLQTTDAPQSSNGATNGIPTTDASGVKETLSPAMDILVSSNFERLLWYLAYESYSGISGAGKLEDACDTVKTWMENLKSDGRVIVSAEVLELARRDFCAERVIDQQILETIGLYYEAKDGFIDESYVSDPHTAVGFTAARRIAPRNPPNVYQVILSTAHPAKFSDAVTQALSVNPSFNFNNDVLPPEFKGLLDKKRRVIDVDIPRVEKVQEAIVRVLGRDVGNSVANKN